MLEKTNKNADGFWYNTWKNHGWSQPFFTPVPMHVQFATRPSSSIST